MLSLVLAAVTSLFAIVPNTPATVGGWTTYLKPYRYSDLLVHGDTVWCATREAGLLRFSQSNPSFASITRFPNGLASNELSAMTYDRTGNLWVGTIGSGVSRLNPDGSRWTLLNAFDGLPSDSVNCLAADGDTLWIGTSRGLAFWNGTVIAGSLPIFGQPSPFGSDNITGIVVRGDTLWVSTDAGAYYSRRSAGLVSWTRVINGLITPKMDALVTNDTLLFALAGDRIYRYVANDQWQVQSGYGSLTRIYADDGVITGATEFGMYRFMNGGFSRFNQELFSYVGNEFDTWTPVPIGGDRYLAASGYGVAVQPAPGVVTGWPLYTPEAPPDNDLRNLAIDNDKVWVNSDDRGVGRLTAAGWRIWPRLDVSCTGPGCDTTFINPVFMWALLVDRRHHKWFGAWGTAIEEMDDSVNPPVFTHHIVSDGLGAPAHTRMWASAADSANNHGRWFGADTPSLGSIDPIGVDCYADSMVAGVSTGIAVYKGNFRPANSPLLGAKVHGLTVDRLNRLWIGMSGQGIQTVQIPVDGINFAGTTPTFTLVPGSNRLDVQGLVARGDTVWALTTHELQRYRRNSPPHDFPVATYTIPEATPLFAANPLAVGPDGSPWVGTEAGVRVYRPGGGSEDFNIRNSPIAGDQIYAIRVDPVTGVAWIATSTGMNRYDPGYRPPPPPQVARLDLTVYPNPVMLHRGSVQLRLKGNATVYQGRIYDLLGRRIGDFDVPANGRVIWDGKDEEGRQVKPGVYLVNVEAGGRSASVRVAVLR